MRSLLAPSPDPGGRSVGEPALPAIVIEPLVPSDGVPTVIGPARSSTGAARPAAGRGRVPAWVAVAGVVAALVVVGSLVTAVGRSADRARRPVGRPATAGPAIGHPARVLGPPPVPLVAEHPPAGSVVVDARLTPGSGRPLEPTIAVFGLTALADPATGPMIMTGHLAGPISPGPLGYEVGLPNHSVDLGDRSGDVIVDGPITWVSWYEAGAAAPARRFVAGRGVSTSTLVDLARRRPDLADPAGWSARRLPDDIGPGLHLLARTTFDTVELEGPGARVVRYRTPDRPGRDLSILVSPDPGLAPALRFLIDDPGGTTIRARPGSAGPLAATAVAPRRSARVWTEAVAPGDEATVAVVAGSGFGDSELDALVGGLVRPASHRPGGATGGAVTASGVRPA